MNPKVQGYPQVMTTDSKQAEKWIQLGLAHLFGFNHYAAITCFNSAIKEDPNICFPYWGISYALGPHYNSPDVSLEDFLEGLNYLKKAQDKKQYGKNWQQDLINVLFLRYPSNFQENPSQTMNIGLREFSKEMEKIYFKYPNDIFITSIYAESIMNLRPWALWLKDGSPTQQAILARSILEKAISKGYHPQIYHLYLHLMQLSPEFYVSLPIANQLYEKQKNVSHLIHMPSHIFIQVGDYIRSMQSNIKAIEADKTAKLLYNKQISFFQFYRAHNVHFLVWAAMFLGDYETAKKYSSFMWQVVNEEVMKVFSRYMEFYLNTQLHVMIRFGKWTQILQKQIQQREDYPIYKTSQRYSRAIAYAVLEKVELAQQEFQQFQIQRNKVKDRKYGNNIPEDVFDVAQAMAKGEILYRKGQYEEAFKQLRKSVQLSDNLVYDQPWNWMQPPRHALGALLLQQNHFEQAQQVYLRDLKSYPNNIWSLTGLQELYERTGNTQKKKQINENLKIAEKNAKYKIQVSCFCKKSKKK